MPAFRDLWRVYPDGVRGSIDPFEVLAMRPRVATLAAVSSTSFAGEFPIESRVIRVRQPLPSNVGAVTEFVDIAGNVWRLNEISQVGRKFWDISITIFVAATASPDPELPPQPGWLLSFPVDAPNGERLRPTPDYITSFPWLPLLPVQTEAPPSTELTGGDGTWIWRTVGKGPTQLDPIARRTFTSPVDPLGPDIATSRVAYQASGSVTGKIWTRIVDNEGVASIWLATWTWDGPGVRDNVIPASFRAGFDTAENTAYADIEIRATDNAAAGLAARPPVNDDSGQRVGHFPVEILAGNQVPDA